jgi:hypothetical protein
MSKRGFDLKNIELDGGEIRDHSELDIIVSTIGDIEIEEQKIKKDH